MYRYIFWVHHVTLGKMHITVRADSREEASDYVEKCPDFVAGKSERRGVVVIAYDAR